MSESAKKVNHYWLKGNQHNKGKRWKSSELTKKRRSVSGKGRVFSDEHKKRISAAKKGIARPQLSGSNNWRWKGGISYKWRGKNWFKQRMACRERDGFVCKNCGSNKGLSVHHIIPFRTFDDYIKANELNNLMTLCRHCHPTFERSLA